MKIVRSKEVKGDLRFDGRLVKKLLDFKDMVFYLNQVPKGRFQNHYHSSSTEFIVFPQGGAITINNQTYTAEPWDIFVLEQGDVHGFNGDVGDIIHFAIKSPSLDDKVNA